MQLHDLIHRQGECQKVNNTIDDRVIQIEEEPVEAFGTWQLLEFRAPDGLERPALYKADDVGLNEPCDRHCSEGLAT